MAQAKSSSVAYRFYAESTYGEPPVSISAVTLPAKDDDLKGTRTLNQSEVKRGDRNAAPPQDGNNDVSGSLNIPLDLRVLGYILGGAIGSPSTVQQAAKSIINGQAAVDRTGGVVGIPVTSHGYQAGESVTIAGTTNYNGTYTVLSSSTTHEVRITATYQAETFGSDDTIRAARYTHTFKVHASNSLPSYGIEKGFVDVSQYVLYEGIKFGGLSFEVGGDKSEIFCKLDTMGAIENAMTGTSVDGTPTTLAMEYFGNYESALLLGGVNPSAKSFSLSFTNNLDGDTFLIGGGSSRGSINEGIAAPTGNVSVMFQDATIYNYAVNGTETSLNLTFTKGVYSLAIDIPEVRLGRNGLPIPATGGVWLDAPWSAYYSNNAKSTSIEFVLVNDVASYSWS